MKTLLAAAATLAGCLGAEGIEITNCHVKNNFATMDGPTGLNDFELMIVECFTDEALYLKSNAIKSENVIVSSTATAADVITAVTGKGNGDEQTLIENNGGINALQFVNDGFASLEQGSASARSFGGNLKLKCGTDEIGGYWKKPAPIDYLYMLDGVDDPFASAWSSLIGAFKFPLTAVEKKISFLVLPSFMGQQNPVNIQNCVDNGNLKVVVDQVTDAVVAPENCQTHDGQTMCENNGCGDTGKLPCSMWQYSDSTGNPLTAAQEVTVTKQQLTCDKSAFETLTAARMPILMNLLDTARSKEDAMKAVGTYAIILNDNKYAGCKNIMDSLYTTKSDSADLKKSKVCASNDDTSDAWKTDPCCNQALEWNQCCVESNKQVTVKDLFDVANKSSIETQCGTDVLDDKGQWPLLSRDVKAMLRGSNDPALGCDTKAQGAMPHDVWSLTIAPEGCSDMVEHGKTKEGENTCKKDSDCWTGTCITSAHGSDYCARAYGTAMVEPTLKCVIELSDPMLWNNTASNLDIDFTVVTKKSTKEGADWTDAVAKFKNAIVSPNCAGDGARDGWCTIEGKDATACATANVAHCTEKTEQEGRAGASVSDDVDACASAADSHSACMDVKTGTYCTEKTEQEGRDGASVPDDVDACASAAGSHSACMGVKTAADTNVAACTPAGVCTYKPYQQRTKFVVDGTAPNGGYCRLNLYGSPISSQSADPDEECKMLWVQHPYGSDWSPFTTEPPTWAAAGATEQNPFGSETFKFYRLATERTDVFNEATSSREEVVLQGSQAKCQLEKACNWDPEAYLTGGDEAKCLDPSSTGSSEVSWLGSRNSKDNNVPFTCSACHGNWCQEFMGASETDFNTAGTCDTYCPTNSDEHTCTGDNQGRCKGAGCARCYDNTLDHNDDTAQATANAKNEGDCGNAGLYWNKWADCKTQATCEAAGECEDWDIEGGACIVPYVQDTVSLGRWPKNCGSMKHPTDGGGNDGLGTPYKHAHNGGGCIAMTKNDDGSGTSRVTEAGACTTLGGTLYLARVTSEAECNAYGNKCTSKNNDWDVFAGLEAQNTCEDCKLEWQKRRTWHSGYWETPITPVDLVWRKREMTTKNNWENDAFDHGKFRDVLKDAIGAIVSDIFQTQIKCKLEPYNAFIPMIVEKCTSGSSRRHLAAPAAQPVLSYPIIITKVVCASLAAAKVEAAFEAELDFTPASCAGSAKSLKITVDKVMVMDDSASRRRLTGSSAVELPFYNAAGAIIGQRVGSGVKFSSTPNEQVNNVKLCLTLSSASDDLALLDSSFDTKDVIEVATDGTQSQPLMKTVTVNSKGQYCITGAQSGTTYLPIHRIANLASAAADAVGVAAEVAMAGLTAFDVTDPAKAADVAALQAGLASLMSGIDKDQITINAIIDASTSRRALLGLAASVKFTVVVSPAAQGSIANAADLQTLVTTTMTAVESDPAALIAGIKADYSSPPATWDSITVSATTVAVPASCSTITCGAGFESKSTATYLYCATDTCDAATADKTTCCDVAKASCSTIACGTGFALKSTAASLKCATDTCDPATADKARCCDEDASCSTITCGTGFTLKSTAASLKCVGFCDAATADKTTCCDEQASCSTIACGTGFTLKSTAASLSCATDTCDPATADKTTCCDDDATLANTADAAKGISSAVSSKNKGSLAAATVAVIGAVYLA